eukprot:321026_1
MWSLGPGDTVLRDEIHQFRRNANDKIQEISSHIASLNNIEIDVKLQENFLISIQKYSKRPGASPYYLHYLLGKYNLYFIAVLFSMLNTSKTQEFQHRFCMLAEFLCNGCWTFADQLSFLKLINILLTHSNHLNTLLLRERHKNHKTNNNDDDDNKPQQKKINPNDEQILIQNQKFMIYHNFIQWIINLAVGKGQNNDQTTNKYHNHSYPDLNRQRIFEFINLMVLHRYDIIYKLISYLDIARKIYDKSNNEYMGMAEDEETEQWRTYLGPIYYTHFIGSIVPIVIDSPSHYVAFIGKILQFGYKDLAKNIINKFEETEQFINRIKELPLINDIHNYVVLYLNKFGELISYLSINRNHKTATITTKDANETKNNNNNNKIHESVRKNLKMNDNDIISEAKMLLLNLIEFIDYFDNDLVIEYLSSVIPPPNDDEIDNKNDEEYDRLDLRYHRSICYTNLASICMIEQDFENVMEYSMRALDNNLKNIQSHRYFIAGLITTLHSYNNYNSNEGEIEHFHPQKEDIQKALKIMFSIDNKHPFGVKVEQFFTQYIKLEKNNSNKDHINYVVNNTLKILNCKRRIYGRYTISPKYKPNARCLHTINAINKHELIMFGGMKYYNLYENGMDIYNDIWILDMYDNNWKLRLAINGSPNGRYDHSSYLMQNKELELELELLIIIGGKMNKYLHINNNEDCENNKLIYNLLYGNYKYNLIDIYDINNNIWI